MIALRVTRRPGATESDPAALPVPPDGLTIGRGDDCGLVLADPLRLVSRQHAQVRIESGAPRVRCVSSTSPLWVNGVQLDPGAERALQVGDRLRIGGFEIAVEAGADAPAPARSRLDHWFDLDSAADPLGADSPLPAIDPAIDPAPAPGATPGGAPAGAAPRAVVSWETSRRVVRTSSPVPPAPTPTPTPAPAPAPPPAAAAAVPAPSRAAAPPARPAAADPVSSPTAGSTRPAPLRVVPPASPPPPKAPPPPPPEAPVTSPTPAAPAAEASAPAPRAARKTRAPATADVQELAAAFRRGAGLDAELPLPTPEWMEHVGQLMRATAEGTLALLQSRAVAKRHMRAEATHIAPRQNNPLKFSPDAAEALTRMLRRDPSPGFLGPVAALRDAHRDLLVHQVAMVAGMRAAVFELFSRLGPEAAEAAEGPPQGLSQYMTALREAALWRRHCMQHAQLLEHLDDDFQTIFGREFLRAYEAQSHPDAESPGDEPPPEDPWPNAP